MNLKYNNKQLGLGEVERHIIDTMTRLGMTIIGADNLEKEFGYKRAKSNLILSRLCKKGWLQRLKAGVYRIVPLGSDSPDPMPDDAWSIAMKLFSPCYISGWTAAEHWDLTEQIFNTTVVLTGQKQKKKIYKVAGLTYRTKFIPAEKIFGIQKIWSGDKPVQISDLHRTIIDILDDPEIGGGGRHTIEVMKAYWKKKEADPDLLLQYAETLNHGAVFKRLGFVAEKIMHMPNPWLEKLHSRIKTGIINFDPNGPKTGPIVTKWGIRINIPMEDIL
jgi:predicted transcriptional regulator of viral defense system